MPLLKLSDVRAFLKRQQRAHKRMAAYYGGLQNRLCTHQSLLMEDCLLRGYYRKLNTHLKEGLSANQQAALIVEEGWVSLQLKDSLEDRAIALLRHVRGQLSIRFRMPLKDYIFFIETQIKAYRFLGAQHAKMQACLDALTVQVGKDPGRHRALQSLGARLRKAIGLSDRLCLHLYHLQDDYAEIGASSWDEQPASIGGLFQSFSCRACQKSGHHTSVPFAERVRDV